MKPIETIEEYRKVAKRRLPKLVFDYVDGGAESRFTVRENVRVFQDVTLRPRGGTDPTDIDLSVSVLGHAISMPVMIAPTGLARVVHTGGDAAGARAATRAGTIFVQSAMSSYPVEEVVAAAGGTPVWYQAYRIGAQWQAEQMVERVRDAGVAALVVTMDSTSPPMRKSSRRMRARTGPTTLLGANRIKAAPGFLKLTVKPRWLASHVLDGIRPRLSNVLDEQGEPLYMGRGAGPAGLGWHDLPWIRERFDGPIVVKGIVAPDDARRAVDEGAAAIIVSNHGGRQLDYSDATLRALPAMVDAVNGACEVLVDGGVRTGIDVLKAVSLGARAVLIGRAWLWGLAAEGERGVDQVLEIFRDDIYRNFSRLGAVKISELDRSYVRIPSDWLVPQQPRPQ